MDRSIDDIRLELHQEVVLAGAAVDLQSVQLHAGAFLHGCQHVVGLECQGLQGSADDVILVDTAGKSHDGAACVGIPVGSAQAGECRDHIAAVGVVDSGREVLGIRRLVDHLDLVAQPLDRSACYEDGAFQSILDLAVKAPRDGGQKSVVRIDRLVADVHQHEAAGAVGVLRHARLEAGLSEQSRLLVACHACDLDRAAEEFRIGLAVDAAGGLRLGQHAHRNLELLAELFIPLAGVDVEHQGSGSVGVVRRVDFALGQLEDQPAVNGTECQLALLCSLADARDVVQDPAKLRAGEIGVEHQAGLVICGVVDARILLHELSLHVSGSAALPHDRVIDRLSGSLVPYDGGLTLVGDTDGSDILVSRADLLHGLTRHGELCLPDLACVMLDPAGLRVILCEFLLGNRTHFTLLVEKDTPVAGGSCVQCHYVLRHSNSLLEIDLRVYCKNTSMRRPPPPAGPRMKKENTMKSNLVASSAFSHLPGIFAV